MDAHADTQSSLNGRKSVRRFYRDARGQDSDSSWWCPKHIRLPVQRKRRRGRGKRWWWCWDLDCSRTCEERLVYRRSGRRRGQRHVRSDHGRYWYEFRVYEEIWAQVDREGVVEI